MNLIYFKATNGNFGDDLNPFIFNQLFSCFTDFFYTNVDFYGIGTLIDQRINEQRQSIFWGTGIRDVTHIYNQKNWNIFFLRGPISANFLRASYITDAAYSILLLKDIDFSLPKRYKVSIVPHYRHMETIDWSYIGKSLNIHIIDPRNSVEFVIKEIASSEKIIASAMHGAIMADICRVPWLRLRMEIIPSESFFVSDLKWNDWLLSMSLKNYYIPIQNYEIEEEASSVTYYELFLKLKQYLGSNKFQLSSDAILDFKIKKIIEKTCLFKTKFRTH